MTTLSHTLHTLNSSLRQELSTLNSSLRQELQAVKQVKKVAFSAVMDHIIGDVRIGQVIRYNKILMNEGHHYDSITGVFTAPTAGVYQFSFFLGTGGTDRVQAWIQLMVEGQSKAGAVVDHLLDYQDIQGGNVVIVRLNANDRVWMEEFHENSGRIYGNNGFTTFSGALLFE